MLSSQIVCSHGWLIPMLISWVLTKSTKHSTNRINIFIKKKNNNNNNKNNLKAVFWLLEMFVYIQLVTWTRLSSNAKFGNAQFEPSCIKTLLVSFICPFRRRQVNLKNAFLGGGPKGWADHINSRLMRRYTFALVQKMNTWSQVPQKRW